MSSLNIVLETLAGLILISLEWYTVQEDRAQALETATQRASDCLSSFCAKPGPDMGYNHHDVHGNDNFSAECRLALLGL